MISLTAGEDNFLELWYRKAMEGTGVRTVSGRTISAHNAEDYQHLKRVKFTSLSWAGFFKPLQSDLALIYLNNFRHQHQQ